MSVVSNTGPLIALAKVDQLSLLERLFGQVHIAPMVHRELLAKAGSEAVRLDQALATFITVSDRPQLSTEVEAMTRRLDAGEQEAIALAHTRGALLLMDDRLGRQAARRLNVTLTGTVGLLIRAEELGLVPRAAPILEEMRLHGYWLSDALIARARRGK